jgi:hypothetical protein
LGGPPALGPDGPFGDTGPPAPTFGGPAPNFGGVPGPGAPTFTGALTGPGGPFAAICVRLLKLKKYLILCAQNDFCFCSRADLWKNTRDKIMTDRPVNNNNNDEVPTNGDHVVHHTDPLLNLVGDRFQAVSNAQAPQGIQLPAAYQQSLNLNSFWQQISQEIEVMTGPELKNHLLPLSRIKKIMKSDEDVKVSFILNKRRCIIFFC